MKLSEEAVALLNEKSIAIVSTLMPDGSPQATQTWCDTDGTHVVVNIVKDRVKYKNMKRDPRVAVAIIDPNETFHYVQVRGRVVEMTEEGGREHIEKLSQKYMGKPYDFSFIPGQVRVVVRIAPESISSMGGR